MRAFTGTLKNLGLAAVLTVSGIGACERMTPHPHTVIRDIDGVRIVTLDRIHEVISPGGHLIEYFTAKDDGGNDVYFCSVQDRNGRHGYVQIDEEDIPSK